MSDPVFSSLTALFGVLILYLLARLTGEKYPPGPKGYPFVGHIFQVPVIKPWRYFERLSHQYGMFGSGLVSGPDSESLFRTNRKALPRWGRHHRVEQGYGCGGTCTTLCSILSCVQRLNLACSLVGARIITRLGNPSFTPGNTNPMTNACFCYPTVNV